MQQKVRARLHEIRGVEALIIGLCHPSLELRSRILSEMEKFGVPHDPFTRTGGIATELKRIAHNNEAMWYKRAAAISSLVQIAQMDSSQQGENAIQNLKQKCRQVLDRAETLRWVLEMLESCMDENVHYALAKGLGTLLKGKEETTHDCAWMPLCQEDGNVVLHALEMSDSQRIMDVVADLNAYSDGLMDWVLSKSYSKSKGKWPMRHVLNVFCSRITTSNDLERAVILAKNLFGRVHAVSSEIFKIEASHLFNGLKATCKIIETDTLPLLLPFLKSGEVLQRVRVIEMAAKLETADLGCLSLNFACKSLVDFASSLLCEIHTGVGLKGQCLLDELMEHEIAEYRIEHMHFSEGSQGVLMHVPFFQLSVIRFLLHILTPVATIGGGPEQVVAQLTASGQLHEKNKHQHGLDSAHQHEHQKEQVSKLEPTLKHAFGLEVQSNKSQEKSMHKSQETSTTGVPVAKLLISSCEQDIQKVSLQFLADSVAKFTPNMLKLRQTEANLLHLYCAARLWTNTDLIRQDTAKSIADCLKLSSAQSLSYENAFSAITEPWKSEYSEQEDGSWHEAVSERMQSKKLGRIFFKYVLLFIREKQTKMLTMTDSKTDGVAEMLLLEEDIQRWQVSFVDGKDDAGELLEKQFLLKELRIGKRSQEFPTWAGIVNVPQVHPPYTDHRPVVNLLLNAMSFVDFDTEVCFTYQYTSSSSYVLWSFGIYATYEDHRPDFNLPLNAMSCICIHIYTYIYTYTHLYICMYIYMYVCIHIHAYICIYVCMYICLYMCMYIYIYMYLNV